jgi:hypothetical protein
VELFYGTKPDSVKAVFRPPCDVVRWMFSYNY